MLTILRTVFVLALLLTQSCVWGQSKDLIAAEKARFAAMTTQDTLTLKRILHPDLVYIHSNGLLESKTRFMESVATGRIRYDSLEHIEARQSSFGKTGFTEGIVRVKGRYEGNVFTLKLRYTTVYRRKKGVWMLYRWQSTKL
jgi:hypothetical protein